MTQVSGLVEIAKRYELQGLEKNKRMMSEFSSLEKLLNEVIESQRPSQHDYEKRRNVICLFNEMAREIYGNDNECPVVNEFGSFLMDMFDVKSDLDLSMNFSNNADRGLQVKTLRKFGKKLYVLQRNRQVSDIQLILSARVPVVKVTHRGTGVECDLSVGNSDGILKSQILLRVSAIDNRFKKLSLLMKAWAKAHGINSAKDGTMNSLSLILLAAFHLQTRAIPILPPFSAILKDGVERFLNYGAHNKESLAELFVSLLLKLESVETLWEEGLCASTHEGSWLNKKLGCITIEDFIDQSQNVSRALKSTNKGKIYSCIRHSIEQIRLFTEGKVNANLLKDRLFKPQPVGKSKGDKKRKRKRGETNAPQCKRRPGNTDARRPTNIITPSDRGQVGVNNVTSTSNGGTSQGPRRSRPEEAPFEPPSQLIPLYIPIQGSRCLGHERPPVGTSSRGASSYLTSRPTPSPKLSSPSFGGFRPQRALVEHVNYAASSFSSSQPLSFPRPPIQEFGRFRTERTYVGTSRHAPNFPAPVTYSLSSRSPGVAPVTYSVSSRSPGVAPPHLPFPCLPDPIGLRWSDSPHQPPPFVRPYYGERPHGVDDRVDSGHHRYLHPGYPSSWPRYPN